MIEVVIGESYMQIRMNILPDFLKKTYGVKRVKYSLPIRVDTEGGRQIYFLSENDYPRWCKGRTYYIGRTKYHSGYEVQ